MGISDSLAHVAVYYMALGDPMFMCLPHYTRHPVLLRAAILVRFTVSSQYVSGFAIFRKVDHCQCCVTKPYRFTCVTARIIA